MKEWRRRLVHLLVAVMLLQCLGVNAGLAVAAEEPAAQTAERAGVQTEVYAPIRANATFGTTVRGGSYADTPAAAGSGTIPREIIEAKWAGDMSYSRRGHLEFDAPGSVNWNAVTSIKLVLYLYDHSGSGKTDAVQVFKTGKPEKSEENWTWNNTDSLMANAEVIGQKTFGAQDTGSWVEIDVTHLKDIIAADSGQPFALALYPVQRNDQGGVKFYSQHQSGGIYTPYLNISESEYEDTLPPTVHVTGLTDGSRVTEPGLTFYIQATDNHDAAPVIDLTVNGQALAGVNGSNTVQLRSGSNVIQISAQDASGNISEIHTYQVEYTKTYIYPVIADSYTDVRSPAVNYNNSAEKGGLQLKTPVSNATTRKVYLSYDLSANELPYVKEAGIELYVHELMGTDRTNEIVSIYEVSDFDEAALTWETAPANGGKVADASYERSGANRYVKLDITNYINRKLANGEPLGRVNFVLQIENGHDQKGVHLASKERYPNNASRLVMLGGLPVPTLAVSGIEDKAILTAASIQDVSVKATSVSAAVAVNVAVYVNETEVYAKGNTLYDIPLQIGTNTIRITAADQENNRVQQTYTVTRLNVAQAAVYYVDSISGDDANDGLSEQKAWKSLDNPNSVLFQPGSKILFKRGSIWNGQFRPNGSGAQGAPIIVDAYGDGSGKPIINGNGISNVATGNAFAEGAVHLYNLSYWELNNLEVTNQGVESPGASRAGIMVAAGGNGYVEHVHVRNVYVHDVNSHEDAQKISGGIIFRGDTVDEKRNNTNISSGFKDILVEHSHVKDVAIEGLRTKTYKNGSDTGSIKNENVVFRNNLIENIYGDGIVISEMASGGLVEKNIIRKHSMSPRARNYAGLWLYQTDGVIVQYNEVYDGVNGYNDGEAFDFDIGATNNIYQYNYSHNNRGGFLLTMTSAGAGNVFRYNVSQNDGRGTEIFFCMNDRTAIYNNTIHVGEGIKVRYLVNETNIQNMFFKNNIVHVEGTVENYSKQSSSYDAPNVSNNLFYPGSIASLPGSPNTLSGLVTDDPMLVDPNAESIVMDTWTQNVWDANVANFKLREKSPAIDTGTVIANAGNQDMYGTPLYTGAGADIGAHEFIAAVAVTDVILSDSALTLKVNETHPLTATVLPENATNKAVIWSSSNHAAAEVDANGLVTAKGAGTATITVATADGSHTASLTVIVQNSNGGDEGGSPTPTPTPTATATPMPTLTPTATPVIDHGNGGGYLIPTPTPTPMIPAIKTDIDQGTVTSIITAANAVNSGGHVIAAISPQQIRDAVDSAVRHAAQQGMSPAVEVRVPASEYTAVETRIAQSSIALLIENGIKNLALSSPIAAITFDGKAVAAMRGQAGDEVSVTLSVVEPSALSAEAGRLTGDRPAFDLAVASGGKPIPHFGGTAAVSVLYALQPGEEANAVVAYRIDASGKPEALIHSSYNAAAGTAGFRTGEPARYVVGYNKVSFADVPEAAWYSDAVGFVAARNVAQGTGEGRFNPDTVLTRAQFIVMAMRAYGFAPDDAAGDNFADAGEAYYTGYLAVAKRLNLSLGVGNNRFAPGKAISREEQITLLYHMAKLTGELPAESSGRKLADFADAGEISAWAAEAMDHMVGAGIVNGIGGHLNPAGTATRAQMVYLLYDLFADPGVPIGPQSAHL